ncbi:MAG: imidazolonepropionase [Bacteroidia bacterium]|nr:imidazolonepropionase [Bacteroidia bacterium]
MNLLITNIGKLLGILEPGVHKLSGAEMSTVNSLENAWLLINDGKIKDFGTDNSPEKSANTETYDAQGSWIMPCFADSHTHIVFAKSREEEFVLRIKGATYEEIAEAGGGILNSAKKLHDTSEDDLFKSAEKRLQQCITGGTGAIEIKSGYGLTVEDELKMLRVIQRLKQISPIEIKATFLGAHAVPALYKEKRQDYIRLIIDEMLPEISKNKLADFIDVFCDKGFFTQEETAEILSAGKVHGLVPKIHANELGITGGVQVGVAHRALSVDHLEHIGEEEIECLRNTDTMPVALPGTSFFLKIPYTPVRVIIDAGLPVAIASDFNPGSSPSGNMFLLWSLACIQGKLLPEEAFNALTINGAYAMGLSEKAGSITRMKAGNLIVLEPLDSLAQVPYFFGKSPLKKVIIKGKLID